MYKALKDSLEEERSSLTDVDKRTALMFLDDFEQAGVGLAETEVYEILLEIYLINSFYYEIDLFQLFCVR